MNFFGEVLIYYFLRKRCLGAKNRIDPVSMGCDAFQCAALFFMNGPCSSSTPFLLLTREELMELNQYFLFTSKATLVVILAYSFSLSKPRFVKFVLPNVGVSVFFGERTDSKTRFTTGFMAQLNFIAYKCNYDVP